jgi:hypothetical protein
MSTLITFAEARFHQMARMLQTYRLIGMPETPWAESLNFGEISWGCRFEESLVLTSREPYQVPIWFQSDAYFDGEPVAPSERPFVPLDFFETGDGKMEAGTFAKIIAPQIMANSPDCSPYFLQGMFSSEVDLSERVRITNRHSEFIEGGIGECRNITHFSVLERERFMANMQNMIERSRYTWQRVLSAESLFRKQ